MLYFNQIKFFVFKIKGELIVFIQKLSPLFVYSSVRMEESSVMQGAQGFLVQNWPTVSSAPGKI